MTNKEYQYAFAQRKKRLLELRSQAKSISIGIIGESLFVEDFYFCSSIDRCMNLIDGLISMLQERNLTCAGVFLRIQMDNCMRSYAAFIAQDRTAVINSVIRGEKINRLKDINGKLLSDGHLKNELAKFDPIFATVYEQVSGYVHLSEKAFYQTIVNCEHDTIEFQVGLKLPEKRNPYLIEVADAFIQFVHLHFKILEVVADSKQHYDASEHLKAENEKGSQ